MCGFVGFFNSSHYSDNSLEVMLSSIKHRGPDSSGYYQSDKLKVGHVRLSLVDLQNGNQPMIFNDWVIVFNGEIYNHKDLRSILISKGYHFDTDSDTEVILKLFHFYGYEFIELLNGIFSIVLYNCKTNELVLARDFFGVKPLYFYKHDGVFTFASEIKSIFTFLLLNKIPYEFNKEAISEYLLHGYISKNQLIDNCFSLDSGCVFSFLNNDFIEKHRIVVKPKKTSTQILEDTLSSQIKRELEADVEIGILLSGGIDSSLITALSSKTSKSLKTFSISYKESSTYDESIYAKIVASKFGTTHHEFYFTERDLIHEIDNLVDCMDQPIYDPAMLPMLFLSEKVRKEVKAVLSGDGGDELFGGYVQYRIFKFKNLFRFFLFFEPLLIKFNRKFKLIKPLLKNIGHSCGPFFNSTFLLENSNVLDRNSFNNVKEFLKFDVENELKYKLLVKTDLTSMFKGLEIRVPFLNLELYAQSLSLSSSKLLNLFKGKLELRKILSKYLSNEIVNKKKVGFRVPIREWVTNGKLGELIEFELINNLLIPDNVISKKSIDSMLTERQSSRYCDELFALYILNKWLFKNSYNENITDKRIV